MWCEKVLGNIAGSGAPIDESGVDYVDVGWRDLGRVLKARSGGGQEVRVLLPPGERLRHGDVLGEAGERRIVVRVMPCELVVARPTTAGAMALLALELGNLHWPTQVGELEVVCVEDGPVLEILEKLKIAWTRETRRFEPAAVSFGAKLAANYRIIRGNTAQAEGDGAARSSASKD